MALQEIDPRRKFDIEESWKRLDLNEGGKLLALFHAALAYAHQDLIDEDKIEIYAYLMKTNGLIPFRSPFKFNPVPYFTDRVAFSFANSSDIIIAPSHKIEDLLIKIDISLLRKKFLI